MNYAGWRNEQHSARTSLLAIKKSETKKDVNCENALCEFVRTAPHSRSCHLNLIKLLDACVSRSNLMEALEAKTWTYLSRQFFFTKTTKQWPNAEHVPATTGGLATTEVNFLGIELPSAFGNVHLVVLDWKLRAHSFRYVYLAGAVDAVFYTSAHGSRRQQAKSAHVLNARVYHLSRIVHFRWKNSS